jgi:hypothetical protein
MMIQMIAMLTAAATAYYEIDAQNFVHEWGVVVFEHNSPVICGIPGNEPVYFPNDICAEAPVIWIHGEPFTGSFTVELPENETFTVTYPDPDAFPEQQIVWEISGGSGAEQSAEEILPVYEGPFNWAMPYWRAVPSLTLYQKSTGTADNFLYYECTVNTDFTNNFFQWGQNGNPVFSGTAVTEALYFTPDGVFPVSVPESEFIPGPMPMGGETSLALAPLTFSRWAESRLEASEITALFETWKPVLTEDDSYWLVFPIPAELNNEISSIMLEPDGDSNVEYERFFLGAVKLNLL